MAEENTTKESNAGRSSQRVIELQEAEQRSQLAGEQAQLLRGVYEKNERADSLNQQKPGKAAELREQAAEEKRQIAKLRKQERGLNAYDRRIVQESRQEKEAEKKTTERDNDFDYER